MAVLDVKRLTAGGQVGSAAAARILQWMQVETGATVTAFNGTTTAGENRGVWAAGFYGPGLEAMFNNGIYLHLIAGAVTVGYQ